MPRWAIRTVVALTSVLIAAAGGIGYLLWQDSATPVDVEEAVDRYREERPDLPASGTTTEPARTELPAEGVYVYETEGEERIDILGGSTHQYPVETTVTISHNECGLLQRWAPLAERWDEEEVCVTEGGRERRRLRTHHEFFGISDDQDFGCEPGYLLFPEGAEPGDTWPTSCRSADTELDGTATVVGFEERTVAGEAVETIHLRVTEDADSGSDGPSSDDYWWRTSDGLLVERSSTVDTRSDSPVGTATYSERFTLRLVTPTPRT